MRLAGSASVMPGGTADMSEADLIAARQARTGFFSNRAPRVHGQTVHRDFSDEDDPQDHGRPVRGGQADAEIERLMAEHNDKLGSPFGGEHPRSGNARIRPKIRSGNRVHRASGSAVLAPLTATEPEPAPDAAPAGTFGYASQTLET